jgi:hypothetical protein
VLLNNGDGTFASAVNYGVGHQPYGLGFPPTASVAVGDFDGDGRLDLAATNYLDNRVSVLLHSPNSSPTDIALSGASVAENQPAGTVVGAFSTADPDASHSSMCPLRRTLRRELNSVCRTGAGCADWLAPSGRGDRSAQHIQAIR